jgi:nitroreductase
MVIAVFSRNDFDCQNKDGREYFLFDTGMSVGLLILRAIEMGLVAHPIAGFSQDIAKKALNILDNFTVITLIAVRKHASDIKPQLTEKQALQEQERPLRKNLNEFVYIDFFK